MSATQVRGLGKGLSALISETYSQKTEVASNDTAPATLPVTRLQPGRYQPRTHFNEQSLHELAESIERNGLMQPIIVRPRGEAHYEIIAGERRWRAAKMAGLTDVPVIVRDLSDQQALEFALIENVQRADLSPLEEAIGYQRLLDEFNYTQEELGSVVGKSRSHIANMLRLLSLPEEIKAMLAEGELTMGHARALLNAQVGDPVALAKEVVRRGLNVRQIENLIRGGEAARPTAPRNGGKPRQPEGGYSAPSQSSKDPDILALEETLSENLGLKVVINDRDHAGEVTVSYGNLEQLDEILRRLGGGI